MERRVEPEWLDGLAAEDPQAAGSRRDLRRLNAWMALAAIQASALRSLAPGRPPHLVELGAGDGRFLLRVVRRLCSQSAASPGSVTLVDRQDLVAPRTRRQFQELGWTVSTVRADVFAWLDQAPQPLDVAVANLFLHHFDSAPLARLLAEIARRARAFVATEPRRNRLALWFSRRVRWLGCNRVTQHDAPASVRAGFAARELSSLWPAGGGWCLSERAAGGFGHLFVARRVPEADR